MKTNLKSANRFLALLLSLVMVASMIPVAAVQTYASSVQEPIEGDGGGQDSQEPVQNATVTVHVTGDAVVEINGVAQTTATAEVGSDVSVKITPAAKSYIKTLKVDGTDVTVTKGQAYENTFVLADDMAIEATVGQDTLDLDIAAKTLTYSGQPQELVTLSGTYEKQAGDTVVWTVDGEPWTGNGVPAMINAGEYAVTLQVEREYCKTFEKTVSVTIALAGLDLSGLEIKAKELTYNGKLQDTVEVAENPNNLKLAYSLDEQSWQDRIPQVTNAGSYVVYVRVSKENHQTTDYSVYPISVTVAKAEITGVTVTGYSGKYDKVSHTAVTVAGQQTGDQVMFAAKDDNKNFTLNASPKVKKVQDSGKYYVQIDRGSNYKILVLGAQVTITAKEQKLSFVDSPATVVYGEDNEFTVKTQKSFEDNDEGVITYKVVQGEDIASVDATGKVTFTGVGTVKIEAALTEFFNYIPTGATHEIEIKYPDLPTYDITTPVFVDGAYNWHNGSVEIVPAEGWLVIKDSNVLKQDAWAEKITETAEGAYSYQVAFKNIETGAITDLVEIPAFAIDTTIPHDLKVTFSDKNGGFLETVIRFLSFGLFCKEEVLVTVECNDNAETEDAPNSGVASIQLFKYPVEGEKEEVAPKNGTNNQFVLPVSFEGTVKVQLTDNVGNTTGEIPVTMDNSNLEETNGYIMIEQTPPVVSEIVPAYVGMNAQENEDLLSGDIEVKFTAQDVDSGLSSVVLEVNGSVIALTETCEHEPDFDRTTQKDLQEHTFTANTANMNPDTNDTYKMVVTVTDNAGNETKRELQTKKDTTAPVITDFKFEIGDPLTEVALEDVVEATDYGYYFKTDVQVTVTAQDPEEGVELTTGVKTITVVLVDVDNTRYTVGQEGTLVKITDIATQAVARPVGADNSVTFTITENFKGQIYAFATDKVGNNPTQGADGTDPLFGYVHPYGSIVETPEKHTDTSSITIKAPETAFAQNEAFDDVEKPADAQADMNMGYKEEIFGAGKQVPLYSEDPEFEITVEDSYSGIASVKTTLIENGKVTKEDIVRIANTGVLTNDESVDDGDLWSVDENGEENNLVTKITRSYTASGKSNNMVLLVELTDRAGNISYDYYVFGIDKTAPKIAVEMNGTMDAGYPGFFRSDREATITVEERNFSNNAVFSVFVTNEKGEAKEITIDPAAFAVEPCEDSNPEYYTYTMKYTFTAEGDYTFAVKATDLVERVTDTFVSDADQHCTEFTIDKTAPKVSVTYNNNSAKNGKYFDAGRTATVTITEHNFPFVSGGKTVNADRIPITIKTARGGAVPKITWKHAGDVHTATIPYTADGDYTFDIDVTDMAGNKATNVNYQKSAAPDDFIIDTTYQSMVTISDVNNGKAYGYDADLVPSIRIADINLDTYDLSLVGVQMDKTIDLTAKAKALLKESGDTVTAVLKLFEKNQDLDGIYTLKVTGTDKAGNQDTEQVIFTVNRFGSVYVFEEYLLNLVKDGGAFVQEVKEDLVFTEYNADKLLADSAKIEITVDGKPLENVQFTVTPEINDAVTVGSSGWYQYKYTISKDNFKTDGVYKISVSSKDATGNAPQNSNYEDKSMAFRVDSTKSEISSIVGLEEPIVNAQEITVKYTVFDTIGIKKIQVFVGGKLVDEITDFTADANNYEGSFVVSEATHTQSVRLVVEDLAGNITDTDADAFAPAYAFNGNVTVSTNILVRWYANKPLFWGSIGGVAVIAAALGLLIAKKKKKD